MVSFPPSEMPVSSRDRLFCRPSNGGQLLASVYLFILFLGLPLVLHNGYSDITEVKHLFFMMISIVYLFAATILSILTAFLKPCAATKPQSRYITALDVWVLAFFLSFSVACLLSFHPEDALIGQNNRYQGFLTVLVYAAVYWFLSRNFCFTRLNAFALLAGFCIVCLIATANGLGWDPLGIIHQLSAVDQRRYVSTLGNINFYSSYLGILFPFILALWCFARQRLWQICSAAGILCGAFGILSTGSESFLLAFFTMILLMPFFLFNNPRVMRRFLMALLMLVAAMQLLHCFSLFIGIRQYVSFSVRLLLRIPVSGGIVCICALLLLALRSKDAAWLCRYRKGYIFVLCVLLLLAGFCLILVNTVYAEHSFGLLDRFLKWNASWGTDRGKIWSYCISAFSRFDLTHQLFGGGPGCLFYLDSNGALFGDAALDSAHNEYLQYLLTIGITGVASYLGMLVCAVYTSWRSCASSPLLLGFCVGLLCYVMQATVNIAQPISTPYLFLFLSAVAGLTKQSAERSA